MGEEGAWYLRNGIRDLLGGRCGLGRPGKSVSGFEMDWRSLAMNFSVNVYYDVVASVYHCGQDAVRPKSAERV